MAGAYGAGRRHCASAGSACLTRRPAAALRSPEPSFALVLGEEGPAPPWITQGRFRGRTAFIALLVTNFVNSARRAPAKPAAPRRAPPPSQSALIHKHRRWREKRQDILVTFIDTVEERAKSAAERVAKSAPNFDVDVRGVPEPCPNLPHGHPPVDGIEHMNPVIMTLALSCSMAQVVKLLDHGMPFGMSVVPIPSDRCNVW